MDTDTTIALLARLEHGDAEAASELYSHIYAELRRISSRMLARERKNHTLQTTALLNEAWLRLAGGKAPLASNRDHFVRIAVRAMRHVLIDHARHRAAIKRTPPRGLVELPGDVIGDWSGDPYELLALDDALHVLEKEDAGLVHLIELHFFSGLTLAESGALLGWTERKASLSWAFAKGWLQREMSKGERH